MAVSLWRETLTLLSSVRTVKTWHSFSHYDVITRHARVESHSFGESRKRWWWGNCGDYLSESAWAGRSPCSCHRKTDHQMPPASVRHTWGSEGSGWPTSNVDDTITRVKATKRVKGKEKSGELWCPRPLLPGGFKCHSFPAKTPCILGSKIQDPKETLPSISCF